MPLLEEFQPNCKIPLKDEKIMLVLTIWKKQQPAAPLRQPFCKWPPTVSTAGGDDGNNLPEQSSASGPSFYCQSELGLAGLHLVRFLRVSRWFLWGSWVRGVCALPPAPQTDTALEGWGCFPTDFSQVYYSSVTRYRLKPSEMTQDRESTFADHKHVCTVLG